MSEAEPTLFEAIAQCLNTCRYAGEWLLDMEMTPNEAPSNLRATIDLKQALLLRDKLTAAVKAKRAKEAAKLIIFGR